MQKALDSYRAGDWVAAERRCRQILSAQASQFDALNLLAVVCAQTGRAPEAATLLARAIVARPSDAIARNNYGNVLRDLGRFDDALVAYELAVRLVPAYTDALFNRAALLHGLGRLDAATRGYEELLRQRPDHAAAWSALGDIRAHCRQHAQALDCYSRAMRLAPGSRLWHNIGATLQALGRLEEAVAAFDRALAIEPLAETCNALGSALYALRRLDEALAAYRQAIALRPDYPETHNNIGTMLHESAQFEAALASFRRALQARPDFVEALYGCGVCLRDLGRAEESLAQFEAAMRLNPELPWLTGAWLNACRRVCAWDYCEPKVPGILDRLRAGAHIVSPFVVLGLSDSASLQRQAAALWVSQLGAAGVHADAAPAAPHTIAST